MALTFETANVLEVVPEYCPALDRLVSKTGIGLPLVRATRRVVGGQAEGGGRSRDDVSIGGLVGHVKTGR